MYLKVGCAVMHCYIMQITVALMVLCLIPLRIYSFLNSLGLEKNLSFFLKVFHNCHRVVVSLVLYCDGCDRLHVIVICCSLLCVSSFSFWFLSCVLVYEVFCLCFVIQEAEHCHLFAILGFPIFVCGCVARSSSEFVLNKIETVFTPLFMLDLF